MNEAWTTALGRELQQLNRRKDGRFAKKATIEDSSEEEFIHSPPHPLQQDDLAPIGTAETDTGLITVSPQKLPSLGRG